MKSKSKKLITLSLVLCFLFSTTLVSYAAERAAYDCKNCGGYTPHEYCGLCEIYDSNNPYHYSICGKQRNHSDWSRCPAWSR